MAVDPNPSLGSHAAENFPTSRVPKNYMYMGNNETPLIDDETALVGFVRHKNYKHQFGLACILNNGGASYKRMFVSPIYAGQLWIDTLGWRNETVLIKNRGYGNFPVAAMCANV
ncbi:uncharacterized protein N7479_000185 [Penicillium vulpinum]|uniref:uncharacterized protein n=1 Tax=Penicillium vulpinum TaxID=29845 RepID=UPI0025466A3E|nr:uncharacterized protein N7479_000185 [Penicillium vulpinum]KAJ5970267.1 hypothetical protein N7479_000185 [Penicillium vulpinum]